MKSKKYSKIQLVIIIILILVMVVQELISIKQTSLTADEGCYIGAGRAIFETGNMRNNVLVYHPPLSYYIGSIFLLPLKFDKSIWQSNDCWQIGKDVMFHSGHNPKKILFLSRLPIVFLSIILAFYVFKWATELYGAKSGLIALFLYSFNPSIIAYSSLLLTDFVVAMMFLISIAFILIFIFYGFQFDNLRNSLPVEHYSDKARSELSKAPIFSKQLVYIYDNIRLPASSYIGELGNLFYISSQPKPSYVFGKTTDNVVWYLVYVTFLIKTGIPLLIFLILLFVLRRKLPKKDLFTASTLWLPIVLLFINFSITNKFSGVRHILVVYLFLFILTSNVVNLKDNKVKTYNIITLILLFYYALSTILIAPYYLSYINELGLGPNNAHKITVGSNIDSGQDLYGLAKYMEKNNIQKIKLSYFGSVDPKDYNISYEYLPSPYWFPWVPDYTILLLQERKEDCSEKKGVIAISVTNLKNVQLVNKTCFDWLNKYEPIRKIG